MTRRPEVEDRIFRWALCVLFISICSTVWADGEFSLTSLIGVAKEADVVSIDSNGKVVLKSGETSLDSLREIRRTTSAKTKAKGQILVELVAGGKLFASQVTTDEEFCKLEGHELFDSALKLPIDVVAAIVFQPAKISDVVTNALAETRDDDRLFLEVDGNVETIDGLIESVSDSEVSFSWNDKLRKLPRSQLLAIGVASSGEKPNGNCRLSFSNGGSLPAKIVSLDGHDLKIEIVKGEEYVVDWSSIVSVSILSDRLKFISDMKPTESEHSPIVTPKRPWRKDRNVSGGPLRLGNRTFRKGLGVASASRLVFELDGKAKKFCVTIGIDSETDGRGDCVFIVHGDGRPIAREAMKGTDKPKQLAIEIASVGKLELIIEPGNDLDLSDHANWCDACLLSD